MMKKLVKYFSPFELALWVISVAAVLLSFFLVGKRNYLSLTASLIGATALIFLSKGHVVGQILTVVFSVFYGIISYSFAYYGEMITYLGMTAPIAAASVVTWIRNPSCNNKSEVKINKLRTRELFMMFAIGLTVTAAFYFILRAFHTASLIISTVSVLTSFIASYLSLRRSEYYALGYAANDVVLIILWVIATLESVEYLAMVICFTVFLINDLYGFFNWSRMKRRQFPHGANFDAESSPSAVIPPVPSEETDKPVDLV